jgi:hypothetical protein
MTNQNVLKYIRRAAFLAVAVIVVIVSFSISGC